MNARDLRMKFIAQRDVLDDVWRWSTRHMGNTADALDIDELRTILKRLDSDADVHAELNRLMNNLPEGNK